MRLALADGSRRLPVEEPDLIRAAQRGDRESFALLVDRYWDRLYRWVYHLTHHRHTAEDLTQETFLKALAHLDSFTAGGNFKAWLFRIAHNNFVNQLKASARARTPLPDSLAADEDGPEELAVQRETQEALAQAVARLPADFRAAFLLRSDEGLSFRQIADVLGLTEETARWRVFKARQKLLNVLAPRADREKS